MIQLTAGQERGLELAKRMSKRGRSIGVICGWAGTGKTTLIKTIISEFKDPPTLLSPTGKAAARITEVTGYGAGTIHRWMYLPHERADGTVGFERKDIEKIARPECGLIIVDEASMVSWDVWNDLQEVCAILDCSLLLIGDAFQLPPVQDKDEKPFSVLAPEVIRAENRVELTEIVRQALDSPIIRLTMDVRTGDAIDTQMAIADLTVMPDKMDEELMQANMVICRSNKARHLLNQRCRKLRGLSGEPVAGEPLLILRNNYELDIYNGEVHEFTGFIDDLGSHNVYDFGLKCKVPVEYKVMPMTNKRAILAPKALDGSLEALLPSMMEKAVGAWQKEEMGRDRAFYVHANYGYALTCHRAQGSEADRVLVCLEPKMNYSGMEGRRWLYTSLSRARERVSIVNLTI